MNKNDKNLLAKDMSCRLGDIIGDDMLSQQVCKYNDENYDVIGLSFGRVMLVKRFSSIAISPLIEEVKPYLLPLSSLTEDNFKEMKELLSPEGTAIYRNMGIAIPMSHYGDFIDYFYMGNVIDYLNSHHFDYRGLIDKGLAIDATGLGIY